jgi:transcriptional/translational regulatory protein YebC/TACO1
MEAAIEAGADDVVNEDGELVVYTASDAFESVLEAMNKAGFEPDGAEVSMIPDSYVTPASKEEGQKIQKIIDRLEECEDTQNVYHNVELPEEEDE